MRALGQKHLGLLGFSLLAVGVFSGCSKAKPDQAESSSVADTPVRYVKVTRQQIAETLELTAKVQADPTRLVHIYPPASGRVTAINVKPGDRVVRGQAVALLTSSDVGSARADYAKAKIEDERSARALDRQRLLFEHGAAAEKDYIDVRAQAESAHAELLRTQQRLELFHANVSSGSDQVALTSPIAGVVLDTSGAPGEFSKSLDNANPLVTVADLSTVWVIGDVYERDVAKLRTGLPATITMQAYPDLQWHGSIGPLFGALDPASRTLKVRVAVGNPGLQLRPEMFGGIRVKVGIREALAIPSSAIVREGNDATVFVKNAGKLEQRQVSLGQTIGEMVEVLDGIREGDEVAADGAELLKGGPQS